MILNQFVIGGTNGDYPIYDFTLELNYYSPSKLIFKTDHDLKQNIANESFMRFFYLDNLLFEGIPYYGRKNGNDFEVGLYNKSASLWTIGGFAIVDLSGEVVFENQLVYTVVNAVLKGSQFSVLTTSVPNQYISISGSWSTLTDFLYAVAKQCVDAYGNTCTVWVDNKNVVYIGALNADIEIDLSNSIVGGGDELVSFINFGGAIVQGGKTTVGEQVFETSFNDFIYNSYNLKDKSVANFAVQNTPPGMASSSHINFVSTNLGNSINIGFDKGLAPQIPYGGDPLISDVRAGKYYSNEILMKDKNAFFSFDENDICFMVKYDASTSSSLDNWVPQLVTSTYPATAGMPYSFIHNISAGFVDDSGNIIVSITMEKYCENISMYYLNQNSTTPDYMSNTGYFRFYLNFENYNNSFGFSNATVYQIPYWTNRNYYYLFWFGKRKGSWSLKVVKTDFASVWVYLTGTDTSKPDMFNGTMNYPVTGLSALGIGGGGFPFIKSQLQTNVEPSLINYKWNIAQLGNSNYNVPMFIGMPQKSIQHKPYLLYTDSNIKYKSQAQSVANNIYRDYTKTISANIEIDPLSFFYPDTKIDVGCTAIFSSPAPITGSYRIKGITATPDTITLALENKAIDMNGIIDKIQKQIQSLGGQ